MQGLHVRRRREERQRDGRRLRRRHVPRVRYGGRVLAKFGLSERRVHGLGVPGADLLGLRPERQRDRVRLRRVLSGLHRRPGDAASPAIARSLHCTNSVCQAPTCGDGIRNEGEAGIDCAGPCPLCGVGKTCGAGTDCSSKVCATTCRGALVQRWGRQRRRDRRRLRQRFRLWRLPERARLRRERGLPERQMLRLHVFRGQLWRRREERRRKRRRLRRRNVVQPMPECVRVHRGDGLRERLLLRQRVRDGHLMQGAPRRGPHDERHLHDRRGRRGGDRALRRVLRHDDQRGRLDADHARAREQPSRRRHGRRGRRISTAGIDASFRPYTPGI